MFHNTTGGKYTSNPDNSTVTYTFPKKASFLLGDVSIPLDDLTVECYSQGFDLNTIKQMAHAVSLIPPKNKHVYNTPFVINDQELLESYYPLRDEFKKNGIEYMPFLEFVALRTQIDEGIVSDSETIKHFESVNQFCIDWNKQNLNQIRRQLHEIINSNNDFPKHISLIYDDRKIKHTSHIILTFEDKNKCTVNIVNSLSALYAFGGLETRETIKDQIDISECIEIFESNYLALFTKWDDEKPKFTLKLTEPVSALFINNVYSDMLGSLERLNINIDSVVFVNSRYNQKDTLECVPFSIQSKLDYVHGESIDLLSSLKETAARLRAEHAILIYLLTGEKCIHHFKKLDADERSVHYSDTNWYPHYSEVCQKLNAIIYSLPAKELKKLYDYYGQDNVTQLALTFKDDIPYLLPQQNESSAKSNIVTRFWGRIFNCQQAGTPSKSTEKEEVPAHIKRI